MKGKSKKVRSKLEVEEETHSERSVMVNMKKSTFVVLKQHLLNLLVKHEERQNVQLVKTLKATTEMWT